MSIKTDDFVIKFFGLIAKIMSVAKTTEGRISKASRVTGEALSPILIVYLGVETGVAVSKYFDTSEGIMVIFGAIGSLLGVGFLRLILQPLEFEKSKADSFWNKQQWLVKAGKYLIALFTFWMFLYFLLNKHYGSLTPREGFSTFAVYLIVLIFSLLMANSFYQIFAGFIITSIFVLWYVAIIGWLIEFLHPEIGSGFSEIYDSLPDLEKASITLFAIIIGSLIYGIKIISAWRQFDKKNKIDENIV